MELPAALQLTQASYETKEITVCSATCGRRCSIMWRASAQEAQNPAWDIRRATHAKCAQPHKQ